MRTKLTLRLEKSLIDQAKAWADERKISLSHVVAMIFRRITAPGQRKEELHPFMQKIVGVAGRKGADSLPEKALSMTTAVGNARAAFHHRDTGTTEGRRMDIQVFL